MDRPRRPDPRRGPGSASRARRSASWTIVGYYGQNFESAFGEAYWSITVSTGLVLASTVVQLVLFRWRRWI